MRFRAVVRRRSAITMLVTVLAATSLVGPTRTDARPLQSGGTAAEGADAGLKAEWDEVLGQEQELVAKVEAARQEQERLNKELADLELQVKAKEIELVAVQLDLEKTEDLAAKRARALAAATRRVSAAKDRLRQQIVASYVSGGESSGVLEALLASENGEDAGSAIAYSKAVVGDTDALVADLARARAARRKADREAKRAAASARNRRDDVKDATSFLAGARDNQKGLVAQVDVEIWNEALALREVQGRKAVVEGRINAELATSDGVAGMLAAIQADQPAWVPGDVRITWPIPDVRCGSPFGPRLHPILHITRLHAGCDMGAPSGTAIHAPADGKVVLAGVRGGYGNTTVLDHGHSLATLYGHQSSIVVTPGQEVKRGDVIGYVGSTGLSTGPHLHFETRVRGLPINPVGVVDFSVPYDYSPDPPQPGG